MSDIFNMADTWNAVGTTWTAIKMDVTNTASAAASLLLDLKVDGSSMFSVSKTGALQNLTLGSVSAPSLVPTGVTNSGIYWVTTTNIGISVSGTERFRFGSGGILSNTGGLSLGATIATVDVNILRDAANTLAQRNGTAWQTFRIYSTYTDASNYEGLTIMQSGSGWLIGNFSAGTGPGNRNITLLAYGQLDFGANGGTKWSITASGHFIAPTDNTYDIGASGATRPRNTYFAGNMRNDGNVQLLGAINMGGTYATQNVVINSAAAGVLRITDTTGSAFDRINIGGSTSAAPAIKRDGVGLAIKLADDTDGGHIKPGKYPTASLPAAATAGAGALVYDTTVNKMKFSTGSAWETITSS